jgi:hypothetical protein
MIMIFTEITSIEDRVNLYNVIIGDVNSDDWQLDFNSGKSTSNGINIKNIVYVGSVPVKISQ